MKFEQSSKKKENDARLSLTAIWAQTVRLEKEKQKEKALIGKVRSKKKGKKIQRRTNKKFGEIQLTLINR